MAARSGRTLVIRFSASLVVIAMGLLVAGGVTSKLLLVYVAIALSVVALIFLIIGAILHRGEFRAWPSGGTAGTCGRNRGGGRCAGRRGRGSSPRRRGVCQRCSGRPGSGRPQRGCGQRHGLGGGHRKTTLARFASARRTRSVGCLRAHRRPAPPGHSAARRPAQCTRWARLAGRAWRPWRRARGAVAWQATAGRNPAARSLAGSGLVRRPAPAGAAPPGGGPGRSASGGSASGGSASGGSAPGGSGAGHVRLAHPG